MSIIGGVVVFAVGIALGAFTRGIVHTVMRRPSCKPMDLDQLALRFEELN